MRILIVDDHHVVRRGVRSLLEREPGFEVWGEAGDGREAIAKAQELKPDAIVMDISMPVMNGLDATREITRLSPEIRIVVLSQHASPEMMREAFKAGAHGYVVKSEASAKLIEALYKASRAERPQSAPAAEPGQRSPTPDERAERNAELEQALRQSEERLRGLVEYQSALTSSLAEGIFTVDTQGVLTFINPAAEALLGWTKEELLGRKIHDAIHNRYPDGTAIPYERCVQMNVLRTGVPLREHPETYIRKDGHFVHVVVSASPLQTNGQITGLVMALRDDTEQRRSREALVRAHRDVEAAAAHLRLVTDTMAVGVTRCSRDMKYVWANESYAVWAQRPLDEIIGRPIVEVLGRRAFEQLLPHFEAVLEGKEVKYEEEVPLGGIGPMWISAVYRPTRNSNGIVDGWVAVVRDISARKHGQAQLTAEATALARLNELSSRLLLATDLSGGLDDVVGSAVELMGAAMGTFQLFDEDLGILRIAAQRGFQKDFLDFFREVSADDKSACGRALRLCRHIIIADIDKDPEFAPFVAVARAAGYRAVLSIPLLSSKGAILGVLSLHFAKVHEPTAQAMRWLELYARQAASFIERWQHETQLRQYRGKLEQLVGERTAELVEANRQLGKFGAKLLQAQDQERRRLARELHDSAGQTITLINLNLSEIEQRLNGSDPDGSGLLKETSRLMRQLSQEIRTASYLLHPPLLDEMGLPAALEAYASGLAGRSSVKIDVEIAEGFGRLTPDQELAIFRIVQEALTNVHRHTDSPWAAIRLWRDAERIQLEIKDGGCGMSSEVLAGVQAQGAGVGIAGMRERVRNLGGETKIESGPSGTTLSVTMPVLAREPDVLALEPNNDPGVPLPETAFERKLFEFMTAARTEWLRQARIHTEAADVFLDTAANTDGAAGVRMAASRETEALEKYSASVRAWVNHWRRCD